MANSNKSNSGNDDPTCCRVCSDWSGIMCCISENDFKKRPLAEVVQNDGRHCTDVPCLLILLGAFVAQIALVIHAADEGADPDTLVHGWDWQGKWCDEDHKDGKLNAWIDLDESFRFRICVDKCADTENDDRMALTYDSENFLGAYCVPEKPNQFDDFDEFGDYSETLQRGISDVDTAKWMIFISAFIALFLGFGYLKVIEFFGKIVVWVSILAFFIGGAVAAVLLIEDGIDNYNDNNSSDTARWQLAIGIILVIVLLLCFCTLLWLRKRIELALQMLDEASTCINDIKSILLFPIFYSIPVMGYFAFWIVVALYIYSVKEKHVKDVPDWFLSSGSTLVGQTDTYAYYTWDEGMQDALIFHFIVLLYFVQVFIYFGFMVLAGTVADWYFSEWDAKNERKKRGDKQAELSYAPVWESLWRVTRYHLGSLAFGALIITIIRVIRATLHYIQKKTDGGENCMVKCLFCCVQCCLSCCQCILDYASKQGFIFTSIYGTNFCYSSYQSIKLIWSNLGRTAMVEGISSYIELFGRCGIAMITTGIAILVFREYSYYENHLSSFIYPAIPVFIIAYLIASLFMLVLEVAIDTIFLCFLVDESVPPGPRFASDELMKLAATHGSVMPAEAGEQHNIVPDTTTAV